MPKRARNGFETAVAAGREAMGAACKAGGEVKGLETAGDLPQAGFEAMAQAGAAFAKGIQGLNGRMFEIARARLAEGAQARKALFGAQTFQEAVDIQRDYVKASFDRAVHDGIEVSNAWVRLAGEAGAPIGRCVSDAIAEGARKAA